MPYLPAAISETITIVRKTRDTRNTFIDVIALVKASIQPAGGGTRLGDMTFVRQNIYRAIMETASTLLRPGDIVQRTGKTNVVILRIDDVNGVQQLELEEIAASL